jgi:uncharacterized membrane protein
MDNLSKSKLIEYRKQEKEAIDYLKKIGNYFIPQSEISKTLSISKVF